MRKKLGLSLLSLLLALVAAELGFRLLAPGLGYDRDQLAAVRAFIVHGRTRFEPHPYLGYVQKSVRPDGSRSIFFDREFPVERLPGVPRVACLGGSTTAQGYPTFLERHLERELGRDVEVQNWGVGNWTSAETMLNYLLNVQDYAPDVIVLHHAVNDGKARVRPDYRPDYSHFRQPWTEPDYGPLHRLLVSVSDLYTALQLDDPEPLQVGRRVNAPLRARKPADLREWLTPESTGAFRRNVLTVAEHAASHGMAPLLVTMPCEPETNPAQKNMHDALVQTVLEHNAIVRELAGEHGFPLLDLVELYGELGEDHRSIFSDMVHMTPEGKNLKGAMIARALINAGLIE